MLRLSLLIRLLAWTPVFAIAQTSGSDDPAQCVLGSFQWVCTCPPGVLSSHMLQSFNSQKQSPCQVVSSLFSICTSGMLCCIHIQIAISDFSSPVGYIVKQADTGSHYTGPTIDSQNPCQCSTVSYSLISACAACQNATVTQWGEWSANCANVSISRYSAINLEHEYS
jgi:hypothetical protein